MEKLKRSNYQERKSVLTALQIIVLLFFIIPGCTYYSAVPLTMKEVKDYVIEKEESLSCTLELLAANSVDVMKRIHFEPSRIEMGGDRGLVTGSCKSMTVELRFDSITPTLTKMRGKIMDSNDVRQFSIENAFFENVKKAVSMKRRLKMQELARGMTPVFLKADRGSTAIAYISEGERVDIIEQGEEWTEIGLVAVGRGYILSDRIDPLPEGYAALEEDTGDHGY